MSAPSCLRCQTVMEQGFVVDRTGPPKTLHWFAGPIENAAALDRIQLQSTDQWEVTTYRCPKCFYLESYAGKKAKWQ